MSVKSSKNDIGKELHCLSTDKLTSFDDTTGHYSVGNQRSAFVRCGKCVNLSEADCYADENGDWIWHKECQFCIQRVIDMLGYYEHGIVPNISLHDTKKQRQHLDEPNDLYSILNKIAQNPELMKDC